MFLNEHINEHINVSERAHREMRQHDARQRLEVAVEGYGSIPRSQASLTAVLQTALWQFLINN